MASLKTFRCWYKDGSARLVSQMGHTEAAAEAQELAGLQNGPAPDKTDRAEYARYRAACKVVKTECLSDGTESKWK
jgi:hypothetical protein